jgi:hypothetical protein
MYVVYNIVYPNKILLESEKQIIRKIFNTSGKNEDFDKNNVTKPLLQSNFSIEEIQKKYMSSQSSRRETRHNINDIFGRFFQVIFNNIMCINLEKKIFSYNYIMNDANDSKENVFIDPEILTKNREELKKKFLMQKENTKKEKIAPPNSKDEYLLSLLKQNPEFTNVLNDNNDVMNTLIQNMINKMTNDPKQKKAMKKKMKSLIENMKK